MMATQLFGTGGIAALLLLGVAMEVKAVLDVALTLALLAAFASVAFAQGASRPDSETTPRKRIANEPRPKHFHDHRGLGRYLLFPRRHGGAAAFS